MNQTTANVQTSSVKLEDRPIEQVREEVIDTLVYNYSHAVISLEAFERRLDVATESESHAEIMEQIKDLQPQQDNSIREERTRHFDVRYDAHAQSDDEKIIAILSSNHKAGQWVVPSVIHCYSILGEVKLDFTNAIFTTPNVTIKVFSLLAGDKIYVPENVNVSTSVINIASSTSDRSVTISQKQMPHIKVTGVSILSDMKVKLKTNVKERFVSFANQMKQMFNGTNRP